MNREWPGWTQPYRHPNSYHIITISLVQDEHPLWTLGFFSTSISFIWQYPLKIWNQKSSVIILMSSDQCPLQWAILATDPNSMLSQTLLQIALACPAAAAGLLAPCSACNQLKSSAHKALLNSVFLFRHSQKILFQPRFRNYIQLVPGHHDKIISKIFDEQLIT